MDNRSVVCSGSILTGPAHELGVSHRDLARFYETHWPRPMALQVPAFYRWQFHAPPENNGLDWCTVSIRDNEVLGIMGLNRRTFKLEGKATTAAELTTWVVAPEARGKGLAQAIMQSLQATYDLLIGFGISQAAMPVYMAYGFRHLARIPRYFRIYDLNAVRSHAVVERSGQRLQRQWVKGAKKLSLYTVRAVKAEDLADAGTMAASHGNLYLRDAASLKWRYDDHPVFNYECYLVTPEGQNEEVAVVLRRDQTQDLSFLHVIDLFGSVNGVEAALTFIDDFAHEHGVAFADLTMSHSQTAGHLLANGWFSSLDDDSLKLPHLFYPIELREPATTSLVIWSSKRQAQAFDFGRLHISRGDLDLDRPTINYYHVHDIPVDMETDLV